MKLTEKRIAQLSIEPHRKDRLVFDSEQQGLAVRLSGKGRRTFVVQYTKDGRKYRVPLGACTALSLAKARAFISKCVLAGSAPDGAMAEPAAVARLRNRTTDRADCGQNHSKIGPNGSAMEVV